MSIEVLQRHTWTGEPRELGDLFRLEKNRRQACAALFTHICSESVISLSAIGFSDDVRQALLYVEDWRELGAGEGCYVLMQRSKHRWRMVRRLMAWIT